MIKADQRANDLRLWFNTPDPEGRGYPYVPEDSRTRTFLTNLSTKIKYLTRNMASLSAEYNSVCCRGSGGGQVYKKTARVYAESPEPEDGMVCVDEKGNKRWLTLIRTE